MLAVAEVTVEIDMGISSNLLMIENKQQIRGPWPYRASQTKGSRSGGCCWCTTNEEDTCRYDTNRRTSKRRTHRRSWEEPTRSKALWRAYRRKDKDGLDVIVILHVLQRWTEQRRTYLKLLQPILSLLSSQQLVVGLVSKGSCETGIQHRKTDLSNTNSIERKRQEIHLVEVDRTGLVVLLDVSVEGGLILIPSAMGKRGATNTWPVVQHS